LHGEVSRLNRAGFCIETNIDLKKGN